MKPDPGTSDVEDRSKMERLRPERRPRQRVQKVWRSVCWADSFSDESLVMDTIDITADFALRKIATLFENRKYEECASLIRRLNHLMVKAILKEVPIDVIHEALPYSACILEALYVKVYQTYAERFPMAEMHLEQLVKRMVCIFAKQYSANKGDKNSNMFLPSFRTVLRIILSVQPDFRHQMFLKKKSIDQCLLRLGHHGMVDSSGGRLMSLHDALKVEFEKVVTQYKSAIQKMDDLSLSAKHPTSSSVTSGKAPTNASHQRLMQVTRSDVQNRLIKNKTLLNVVEPSITSQYLKHLITVLQKRIEYDKYMLFHDTELRKMTGIVDDDIYLSVTLRQFSQGYAAMLQVLREITGDDYVPEGHGNGSHSPSEEDNLERRSTSTVNGKTEPGHGSGKTLNSGVGTGLTGNGSVESLPQRSGAPPSVPTGHYRWKPPSNVSSSNSTTAPSRHSVDVMTSFSSSDAEHEVKSNGVLSRDTTSGDVSALQRQIERLRLELSEAQDQIRKMETREVQLKERLSDQVHKQFTVNAGSFENINLGSGKRPTELIRQYGNLYTDGRVDAMDALNSFTQLGDLDVLKMKILFSVIVLAFRAAQQSLQDLKQKLHQMLNIPTPDAASGDPLSRDLERHLDYYLSQSADRFDLSKCVEDVCTQIYATLYDYPCLKDCPVLVEYIRECVRLSWGLTVLNPSYVIVYDSRSFSADSHTRFHTSNPESEDIQCFLWPSLIEPQTGVVLHKGVVIT
ncbi:uncharacterized protein LOC124278521 isoform X2 [Haliotis rubra]|uniref:uncharacterized protein LOC124278521 isoform X2 n=1 Tax=Haliotis rubra TaxID=36100 RepID=UPI001EE614E3|nr:uncharacterized protein LOC124278521 isoform X2 [Haliotis rubra]